ncbi:ABC transporter substrate-binding protein [Alpinimonas psychrophila]|uniref:Branched-chain amino acid transport system substrate-binding protein n=1 Tax=Alpinimonas psychrophila TaxID=748908 RepID=A0A7W3PPT6_9MICO|nr:ABC transporter substrate-binding protein [Alpinimonas psychrophila]MBA8829666.1 branched-chain amino acid transport system substrate-binding protein [Alpinimonas psychrophila]
MKFLSKTGMVAVSAASLLMLTGCVSSNATATDPSAAAGDPIIFGVVMAETGFMSPFDTPALNTMKMTVADINAAGGIDGSPIELKIIDTGSDLKRYAPAAEEVVAAGAKVVIVTCDYDVASPAALVAESNSLLNIAPCIGDPIYGPQGGLKLGFSMGNGTPGESSIMAEFAFDKGWKNAVFLTDTSIKYTQNQCAIAQKRFTQLGGTVVGTYNYVQGDKIAETVSQISAGTAPDVIFNCGYAAGGAQVAKDIRDGGIRTPIVSGFGMDGTYWLAAVPTLADYYVVTYSSVAGDDPDPRVNALSAAYATAYGAAPSVGSFITGTSTIDAIIAAHKAAGSWDGPALAKAFLAFSNTDLVVGPTTFTNDLHINVERPQRVLQVIDGKLVFQEERAPQKVVFVD